MKIRSHCFSAVFFAGMLVSGCGGETAELLPTPVEITQAQILQHQSTWNANKLSNYRFVYSSVPQCDTMDALPNVTITVKNGQAVSASYFTFVQAQADTPGAIAATVSGPDGSVTTYHVMQLFEVSHLRMTINQVFQTMLDLNQKQSIARIQFQEPLGSPQRFEKLGQTKCDNFIVSLSTPEAL